MVRLYLHVSQPPSPACPCTGSRTVISTLGSQSSCIFGFGCSFTAFLLFIDKAGFPWQPLKQAPSAHTFSEICFVEAKVWCLKVPDACHDRHGISWAEWWLEVTAWAWAASGPLSQHSCLSIETMKVSQSSVAHLEITVRRSVALRGLRTGKCVCASLFSCSSLYSMQASKQCQESQERGSLKITGQVLKFLY